MALCAAFFRFMTAAASVSGASIGRPVFGFDDCLGDEADDLGEAASGEDGDEVKDDDVDALEGFRGCVLVFVFCVCWEVIREVAPMLSTGDKLSLLVSLLCEEDHMSLSGSWWEKLVSALCRQCKQ